MDRRNWGVGGHWRGRGGGGTGRWNGRGGGGTGRWNGRRGGAAGRWRGRGGIGQWRGQRNPTSTPSYNSTSPPPPDSPPRSESQQNSQTEELLARYRELIPTYDDYFPNRLPQISDFEEKANITDRCLKIMKFGNVIEKFKQFPLETFEEESEFTVELPLESILSNEDLLRGWPSFQYDLTNYPDDVIGMWNALGQLTIIDYISTSRYARSIGDLPLVRIGFHRTTQVTKLNDVRADLVGKYITVNGIIVKASELHLHCRRFAFECRICNTTIIVDQLDGKLTYPHKCSDPNCGSTNRAYFELRETLQSTRLIQSRKIRIQDNLASETEIVPSSLECILFGDLVDFCETGDAVILCGTLRTRRETGARRVETLLNAYLEIYSIRQLKENGRTLGGNLLNVSDVDYHAIRNLHDRPNLFRALVNSISPSIIGNEIIKAGLLLALFGGTLNENQEVQTRTDINVLMCGDASQGKSKLLRFIAEVSPRGFYICGSSSSGCGLTVTVTRDANGYELQPGALVIAHNGLLCIDELDKLPQNHGNLLQAMEQQCVSISKAGISRTLPAKTTIIAGANPINGAYNIGKTLLQNLNFQEPLLSRFDLVFVMIDTHDARRDARVTESLYGFRGNAFGSIQSHSIFTGSSHRLLIDKLRWPVRERGNEVDPQLLRKYIAYAKHYVHPKLSEEAKQILQEYYIHLKVTQNARKMLPVTTRALESLIRLTQARAKCELREVATLQDAEDVVEIYDNSYKNMITDAVSLTQVLTGQRARPRHPTAKHLHERLQSLAVDLQKRLFSLDEINQITADLGCSAKTDHFLAVLNNAGILIKKSTRVYELLGPV